MEQVYGATDSAAYTQIRFPGGKLQQQQAVSISRAQDTGQGTFHQRIHTMLGHLVKNGVSRMRGDSHVRFLGGSGRTGAHPTRGTEKSIEYKTYLQASPYSDRSEGDRGVTE